MAEPDDDVGEHWEKVLKAVDKYGLTMVAVIVLGYVVLVDNRSDAAEAKEQHSSLIAEQTNLSRGVLKLADKQGETQMLQEKIVGILRAMCVQGAQTAVDRRECLKENQ